MGTWGASLDMGVLYLSLCSGMPHCHTLWVNHGKSTGYLCEKGKPHYPPTYTHVEHDPLYLAILYCTRTMRIAFWRKRPTVLLEATTLCGATPLEYVLMRKETGSSVRCLPFSAFTNPVENKVDQEQDKTNGWQESKLNHQLSSWILTKLLNNATWNHHETASLNSGSSELLFIYVMDIKIRL